MVLYGMAIIDKANCSWLNEKMWHQIETQKDWSGLKQIFTAKSVCYFSTECKKYMVSQIIIYANCAVLTYKLFFLKCPCKNHFKALIVDKYLINFCCNKSIAPLLN